MRGPGIPTGETRDQLVYLLDLYPTLCEMCDLPIPESVDGISFKKVLENPRYITRPDLYYAFQARIRGVSDGKFKLIAYRTEQLKLTQLFDLESDPYETINLFDCEGYEEITARLLRRMEEYRDEWNEEQHIYGQQFWEQYRRYEEAALHGVDAPKGSSMLNQVKDWGTSKK
jgi:arylsulfatase A-like enzyme